MQSLLFSSFKEEQCPLQQSRPSYSLLVRSGSQGFWDGAPAGGSLRAFPHSLLRASNVDPRACQGSRQVNDLGGILRQVALGHILTCQLPRHLCKMKKGQRSKASRRGFPLRPSPPAARKYPPTKVHAGVSFRAGLPLCPSQIVRVSDRTWHGPTGTQTSDRSWHGPVQTYLTELA